VSVICVAFTVELILRFSVAEKKLRKPLEHRVDLTVVLLPALEFMPFERLLRTTCLVHHQKFASDCRKARVMHRQQFRMHRNFLFSRGRLEFVFRLED
jgi:hypothetical protein